MESSRLTEQLLISKTFVFYLTTFGTLTIVNGMTQVITSIFTHALLFLPYPELTFFGSITPLQLVPQIPIKTKDNQSVTKPLFLVTCISIDAAQYV